MELCSKYRLKSASAEKGSRRERTFPGLSKRDGEANDLIIVKLKIRSKRTPTKPSKSLIAAKYPSFEI